MTDLAALLAPGERLAWSGRPVRLLAPTTSRHVATVVVLVAFLGILAEPSWRYLALPVLTYVATLGLRWYRMRGTQYALTNERVIVLQSFPTRNVTAERLDTFADVRLDPGPGDAGSLCFGNADPTKPPLRLEHVRSARLAFDHARRAGIPAALPAPPPVRRGCTGNVIAILFLVWLMAALLSLVYGPGLMSGG